MTLSAACLRAIDFTAMDTGSRADIDDIVGGQDGVFVMFDDDYGIADVAQVFQCFE